MLFLDTQAYNAAHEKDRVIDFKTGYTVMLSPVPVIDKKSG